MTRWSLTGALVVGCLGASGLRAGDIPQDWENPKTPHNQEGDSGVIDLGAGGSYDRGYSGSTLTYYLNDIEERGKREEAILIEEVTTSTVNVGLATAAEATAIATVVDIGAIAVASVTLANAILNQTIADEELAMFYEFTERNVGAIDYSGSLTVKGYGTLHGEYRDLETMQIISNGNVGVVTLNDGVFDTIQNLTSDQQLRITDATIQNVESILLEKNLTNAGKIVRVDNLISKQSVTNSGEMAYVGNLEAESVFNLAGGSMLGVDLIKTHDEFNNAGYVIVDDLDVGTAINTGDLKVLCGMTGESFAVAAGGSFASAGTVDVDSVKVEDGASFFSAGAVNVESLTTNGSTKLMGPITAKDGISANDGTWDSVGTITTGSLNVSNAFRSAGDVDASGKVTVDSDKDVFIGGSLSALELDNSADSFTTAGAVSVDGLAKNSGTWNAKGASLEAGLLDNSGTLNLAGSLVVANTISMSDDGKIVGTVPTASVKTTSIVGGAIEDVRTIDVASEVVDTAIKASGAGSSVKVGRLDGAASVENVGDLVVFGETSATGAISGAGIGSTATFLGEVNATDVTNFSSILANADMNVGTLSGAGVDVSVSVLGALTAAEGIENVDKLVVAGDVAAETIKGTGEGSVYKIGGTLSSFSEVAAVETLVTESTEVAESAKVAGTGAGSIFRTESLAGEGGAPMAGTVENFERLEVAAAAENAGNITGTGVGSSAAFGESLTNSGTVSKFENLEAKSLTNESTGTVALTGENSALTTSELLNAGTITGASAITADTLVNEEGGAITGTGDRAAITVAGELTNAGTLERYGAIEASSIQNDVSGTITSTGAGSTLKADALTNAGAVANVESTTISGTLENAEGASFAGTGAGSVVKADELTNAGELSNVETVAVVGATTNDASGTIVGVGANSSLTAGGEMTNSGAISGFAALEATTIDNAEGGSIAATGAGSTVKGGALTNAGELTNAETIAVTGDLANAASGTIAATGAGSLVTAANVTNEGTVSGVESLSASGDLTNASGATIESTGAGSVYSAANMTNEGTVAGVESLSASGDLTNASGATIESTGAGSVYSAANVTNEGTISGVETLETTGTLTNAGSGTITATGAGSIIAAEALDNAGTVDGLAILEVVGGASNSGTMTGSGTGSVFSFGTLDNVGTIDGVETIGAAENLSNAAGGTITGAGADASTTVLGDMDNAGDYGGFTTTRVEGNLANSGSFEVGDKTTVIGNFTNDGGTLSTDLYGGALGTVVTHGEATINGGTLELNTIGEQLQIGEYYYVVSTDGGLTVDGELAIEEHGTSPKLFHAEGFYDDYNYYVGLRRDQEYGEDPSSANEASIGQYVDDAAYLLGNDSFYADSDLVAVLTDLDETKAEDSAKATEKLLSMDGEVYVDMGYLAVGNAIRAHERLADALRPNVYLVCENCGRVRHTADACEYCGDEHEPVLSVYNYPEEAAFGRRFWGVSFGAFNDVKGDGNARGFDANTFGLAVGSDAYRDVRTRLGVFGAYQNTKVKGDGAYMIERGEVENYELGVYGYRDNALGTFLGSASVGADSYKATRMMNWGDDALARTHEGKSHGMEYSLRLEEYRNVRLGGSILQPYLAGSFVHAAVDGVRERTLEGSRDDDTYVTQLHTEDYNLTSWRSDLGVRWSTSWNTKYDKPVTFRAKAAWLHEFGDTYASTISSFTATRDGYQQTSYQPSNPNGLGDLRYSVSGVGMGRDYALLGLGFTSDGLWDVLSVFGGYDCLLNKQTTSHNVNLGVDVEW